METYLFKNTVISSFIKQFNQKQSWKVAKYTMIIGIQQMITNDINNYKQLKYHTYSILKDRMDQSPNTQQTDSFNHKQTITSIRQLDQNQNLTEINMNIQQSTSPVVLKHEIQKIKEQVSQLNHQFNQSEIRRSSSVQNHKPLSINDLVNDRQNIKNQSHLITNSNSFMTNSYLNQTHLSQSYMNNQKYKTMKRSILNNADQFLNSRKLKQIKTNYNMSFKQHHNQ